MKKIDDEKITELIDFMEKLSKGIEPITNTQFSDKALFTSGRYKKVFVETVATMKYLLDIVKEPERINVKQNLYLEPSEIKKISISEEPISVSKIAYNINSFVGNASMKKIRATQITSWLQQEGYLKEDDEGETNHKICTEKASEIGISTHIKENSLGHKYQVNLYNSKAQEYIIVNINSISNYEN